MTGPGSGHTRPCANGTSEAACLYAGVFGSLAPGAYSLRLKGGGPGSFDLTLEVPAGRVTEAVIPSAVAAGDAPPVPPAQLSGVPLG